MELIRKSGKIYDNYDTRPRSSPPRCARHHVKQAASRRRCHHRAAATLKALVNHPLTDKGLTTFLADWAQDRPEIG